MKTIKIRGIDHIVLRTAQPQAMIDFYCRILGCVVERKLASSVGLTQLRAGNALIDIVDVNSELGRAGGGAPTVTERNLDHFCLVLEPISNEKLKCYLGQHNISEGNFEERYGARAIAYKFTPNKLASLNIHDPNQQRVSYFLYQFYKYYLA
ncbi:VOC family protein [Zooshikella ganghwensis]|uniref:VOC family protein n=2 Tax=Zooshikella ganghwensis TaxID=202772 RepID=A0A4P9VU75_9GAMM|nr:VOC family protein [Zooshikella ganghwensis]RDH46776.1 VOC family protein [Zooshikella ganghwensis]